MRPQMRVEAVAKPPRHEMLGDIAMRDLRQRVHAGIRTSRAMDANRLAADRLDRGFQRALHRRTVVLQLPAAERTAVIFDGEFVAGHVGATICVVIAGLDPAIHPLRKTLVKIDGYAGQAAYDELGLV